MARLPLFSSKLVGREREVTELTAFVMSDPLVTVTGPGGVGKTRLAVEVARSAASNFPDGVHFVELGGVTDLAQVPAEIAVALGVPQVPGLTPRETLVTAVAPQRLLLVLDTCEQVAAAVVELCSELLGAADDLHVLATSREQLWVDEEIRYRLSPLALPGSGALEEVEGSPAVALFAERARRSAPRFALTPELAPLAMRVVARLDGMPLAIELAAARVEALGLAGLADRIDDALPLLESRSSRAAPRHRSLAAVAEWSYRLLPWAEQRVFRRLSAFPGPFTLEAAEAVAGPGARATVLQLVDCSLVAPPQPGPDQRMRYTLLHTLRDYGRGRLAEAGEGPQAEAAVAAFTLSVAQQATAGLATSDGDRQLAALRQLDAEEATLSAALSWAFDHDPETARQLALALAPWWLARGRLTEGYARLAAATPYDSPGPAPADAHQWLGYLAGAMGEYADSLAHYSAAWATAGDQPSRAAILGLAGRSLAHLNLGHVAEADADAHQALTLARQSGDQTAQVRALTALGSNAYYAEKDAEALAWVRQAADLVTTDVPGHFARRCRRLLALVLIGLGEYDAAWQACTTMLAWCRDADDLLSLADLLETCVILNDLAGKTGPMTASLHEAVGLASRTARRTQLRNYLDEGGNLCAATGRWPEAVTLWAAHEAQAQPTGIPRTSAEDSRRRQYLKEIEAVLDPAQLRAARERGARMTLDAGVEFVALLTAPADPGPAGPRPSGGGELTPRERELVTLVARGRTNAEIAAQLFISIRTVVSHLDRVRAKTGCRRRADLTRLALQEGLV